MFPETVILNIHLHGAIVYTEEDEHLYVSCIKSNADNLVIVNTTSIGYANFESKSGGKWMDKFIQTTSSDVLSNNLFSIPAVFNLLEETIPVIKNYKIHTTKFSDHLKMDKLFGIQSIQKGKYIINKEFSTGTNTYCTIVGGGKEIDLIQKMDIPCCHTINLKTILKFLHKNGVKNILMFDHSCSVLKIQSSSKSPRRRRKWRIKDKRTIRRLSYTLEKEMEISYI